MSTRSALTRRTAYRRSWGPHPVKATGNAATPAVLEPCPLVLAHAAPGSPRHTGRPKRLPSAVERHRISHTHDARYPDITVDPERQRLGRVFVAAVAAQQIQCRQVGHAGLGVAARDQAAADVAGEAHGRLADLN